MKAFIPGESPPADKTAIFISKNPSGMCIKFPRVTNLKLITLD
ncbi:MAG: hypothetical protein APG10_01434 [Candidatus Methanofastidiosum methylothiophilum]|uniref:Uncharacterized protein n=1 Tax=Candidatus Methanofastidiosum methylothiophilum TaxID=1705564 RepID=A0A150IID9_9EURY|nr:MAG: hypothetical protein APG10_01434 [Candidatus Methanofastidiosum methylthiophilus]